MIEDLVKWLSVGYRYTGVHMDRALKPYGLNSSQCMYVIRVCENPGITQDQFLQLFMVNPSNVTRSIGALESLGFLERRCHPKDRRTYQLYPTKRSLDIYQTISQIRVDWQNMLLEGLQPEEQTYLLEMLKRIALRAYEYDTQEAEHHDHD